jgi:PAS domain S-box-containing protein
MSWAQVQGSDIERVREQTDESLSTERRKTDDLLDRTLGRAKNVQQNRRPLDRAKELGCQTDVSKQSDEVDYSGEFRQALERERRAEDLAVRDERSRMDEVVRRLHEGHTAEVDRERERTDRLLADERDQADRLVTRFEVPFHLLVEQVKDYAIFMLDTEGNIVSWNLGAEHLSGYLYEEAVGKHYSFFFTDEDVRAGKPQEELRAAAREGRIEVEGWRGRKDGTWFMANVVVTALHDAGGKLTGFAKITQDVTERSTSAEKALRRSEATLRLTAEATGLGTWDWDVAADVLVLSDRCRAIFGIGSNEPASYDRFLAAVHPDDRRRVDEKVRRALVPSSSGIYENEYRAVLPDGTTHWVSALGRVLFKGTGAQREARRFIGTVLDITQRKHIEEERERLVDDLDVAVKARDEFVAVLSHDLRNPMASILLAADLLLKKLPDDMVELRKRAQTIQTTARGAGRMIEYLLQELALQRGALTLSAEPQDVRALLSDVMAMFEADAELRHLSLSLAPLEDLKPVRCDRDYVMRVFANLVGNALKFTPAGGTIAIGAEAAGQAVKFSVTDSGPGIAPEEVARLFDRGFRGGGREAGLGLGLAIARGIVEACGGAIGVDSELGKGSTFWFTLPCGVAASL